MNLRTTRTVLVAAVAALLAAGLLSACTGVPTTSTPQAMATLPLAPPQETGIAPRRGAFPREIVQDFLLDNGSNDPRNTLARAYLAPEQKNRWSDSATALIYDAVTVGTFDAKSDTVTVTGHEIGQLSPDGQYTPSRQGDGTGGHTPALPQKIGLRQVDGQWRISSMSYNGLLLSAGQFSQYYAPRVVYYYDQSGTQLVPELRYSPLTDTQQLTGWLAAQLVNPPSGSALSTDLPSLPNPAQPKVTIGANLSVDLPGSDQLDSDTKDKMAAQLALTLGAAVPNTTIQITDGARPVIIPQLGTTTFTANAFSAQLPQPSGSPQLYYLDKGGVYNQNGKPLPGPIGSGSDNLCSIALARTAAEARMRVAATAATSCDGPTSQLLTGYTTGALHAVHGLTGDLSRPEWAPGLDEVWVGDGSKLFRVGADGKPSKISITVSGGGSVSGRIAAVRLSPEGYRVALVISASGAATPLSQIWIGSVARGPDSVQITNLHAISPVGVNVTDVAWSDLRELYAIGTEVAGGDLNVYQVRADGSFWTATGIGDLPNVPDSIAVANGGVPAVSVEGTVWVLDHGVWASPESGRTYGTNPVWVD